VSRYFTHPQFEHFEFEAVPLNRDVFLMDERWLSEWEGAYLKFFDGGEYQNIGYISYAAIRATSANALEVLGTPTSLIVFTKWQLSCLVMHSWHV